MNGSIYLTGFMGSGKSTCGKILSQKLGKKYFDTDMLIENDFSMTTFDIIEKFGIEYFRKIENQKISYVIQQKDVVVSLGGGSLIAPKNQLQVLKSGFLVYLKWNSEDLMQNLKRIPKRPLLKNMNRHTFDMLFKERSSGYEKAHLTISCEKKTPEDVVFEIQENIQKGILNESV